MLYWYTSTDTDAGAVEKKKAEEEAAAKQAGEERKAAVALTYADVC